MYESELTKFMREYLEKHPEELESQRIGRAIWWDHEGAARTPPDPANHSPKAGGNEGTFAAPGETED